MKKIYIIDWNSFIYRMFFWLPEFSTKSWEVVNAIFGMAKFFIHQLSREDPDYVIFITDAPWKNFRNDLYKDYKATRDRMPDNLKSQIEGIHNVILKMGIKIISIPWYEADDVIGTLAKQFSWLPDVEVDILSWDKDLYSLVSKNVSIYDTMKRKKFSIEETKEKFWVLPERIIDYLAIVWDAADNIPWITWFWPKKAVDLINALWTVEEIYDVVWKVEQWSKQYIDVPKEIQSCFKWKTFEKLLSSKEDAFLSKKLATIELAVDLEDFVLDDHFFRPNTLLTDDVIELFQKYEFYSLLGAENQKNLSTWNDLGVKVSIIWDTDWLKDLYMKIKEIWKITLDTETTWLDVMKAELVGVSIYIDDENIFYVNRLHAWPQVCSQDLQKFLQKVLALDILVIGHNLKYDLEIIELFLKQKNLEGSAVESEPSKQLGLDF